MSVLPVPGGPTSRTPLGIRAQGLIAVGILEKIDDFLQFVLRFVAAGHVGKGDAGVFVGDQLGLLLPMLRTPPAAPKRRVSSDHKPNITRRGNTQAMRNCERALGRVPPYLTPAA